MVIPQLRSWWRKLWFLFHIPMVVLVAGTTTFDPKHPPKMMLLSLFIPTEFASATDQTLVSLEIGVARHFLLYLGQQFWDTVTMVQILEQDQVPHRKTKTSKHYKIHFEKYRFQSNFWLSHWPMIPSCTPGPPALCLVPLGSTSLPAPPAARTPTRRSAETWNPPRPRHAQGAWGRVWKGHLWYGSGTDGISYGFNLNRFNMIYTVKNKVRMRFWLRVMVARLAPPHGSRILTEETPVNMQKHS